MQQLSNSEQIENVILKVVLENSHSSTILSDLASKIGSLFTAEICVVVSTGADASKTNQVDYWQREADLLATQAVSQLSSFS
jgi:hypothetical protein